MSGIVNDRLYFFNSSLSIPELESLFSEYLFDLDTAYEDPAYSVAIYSEHRVEDLKSLAQNAGFELLTEDETALLHGWYQGENETLEEYFARMKTA